MRTSNLPPQQTHLVRHHVDILSLRSLWRHLFWATGITLPDLKRHVDAPYSIDYFDTLVTKFGHNSPSVKHTIYKMGESKVITHIHGAIQTSRSQHLQPQPRNGHAPHGHYVDVNPFTNSLRKKLIMNLDDCSSSEPQSSCSSWSWRSFVGRWGTWTTMLIGECPTKTIAATPPLKKFREFPHVQHFAKYTPLNVDRAQVLKEVEFQLNVHTPKNQHPSQCRSHQALLFP